MFCQTSGTKLMQYTILCPAVKAKSAEMPSSFGWEMHCFHVYSGLSRVTYTSGMYGLKFLAFALKPTALAFQPRHSISQVIGCEDRLRNDLYCVGWGVKICSLTHSRLGLANQAWPWHWPWARNLGLSVTTACTGNSNHLTASAHFHVLG